jgi:hypothetical protein
MRKNMLTVLILLFSLVLITGLVAEEKQVLPISSLTEREFVADNSKPGGIVIGPAMPRAFHYGGRQTVRDLNGYLHATWEDPTYGFNYYSRSTDLLGLEWTDPVNPHLLNGIELADGSLQYEIDRALMAKMAVDPRTGYLYMMPFTRWNAGERYKTSISRSVDGGVTWSAYTDLGAKIGRPTEEVSWGTMTIGYDPADANKTIFHIAYSKDNQDIMYTRADLSTIDALNADLGDLVFTKSDGVTVGDEAISYVPSGVVFQGTIVLDRNLDPHIIFSGDGGGDTFGDKTPYHIYFKSAASSWGPIPPVQLQAELEACWGMPEMVFDKNNRGYYFLDNNPGDFTFGTWEPPANATSATDFGTLNASGEVLGFEGAVDLTDDNYLNLEITDADNLYLPQADVDDANDVIYVVGNTNSYSSGQGGDIVVLVLENASTYSHTTPPAEMDWEVFRWLTSDGNSLGDVGADMVYDPASSHIDVFWSGSGAQTNEAQYLDASVPPAAIDVAALFVGYSLATDKPTINKGDEITISGILKNNGTSPISPVPVTARVLDTLGVVVFEGLYTAPPLGPGSETPLIEFGTWTVAGDRQRYSVTLEATLPGDEAAYNNNVGTSFYAYPAIDEAYQFDTFDDTLEFGDFAPVFDKDGAVIDVGTQPNANGWTTIDSTNAASDAYLNTWYISSDGNNALDLGFSIRHMFGMRGDTLFGDIPPPAGFTDSAYAQPMNELLISPVYDITGVNTGSLVTLEFSDATNGGDGASNFPIYAFIDLSVDGGTTWETVVHRSDLEGETTSIGSMDLGFAQIDITDLVMGHASVQIRFWWRNPNNDGGYGTWTIDNLYIVERGDPEPLGVGGYIMPTTYALAQNYPNPFNPSTMIEFSLPKTTDIRLDIHNLLGQKVKTLIDAEVKQGTHKVRFDASEFSAGVYFYTLTTPEYTQTKKLIFLK